MASSQPALTSLARPSYAGLGRRLGAHLLDVVIAFSVVVVVGITMRILHALGLWMPVAQGLSPGEIVRALGFGAKLLILLAFVLAQGAIYRVLFEASPWQASFGKRLLNIYVADNAGQQISTAQSFCRWLAKWLFGLFGGSFVSAITIVATENRKALHDFAAKTLVMTGRPVPGGSLEPWRIAAAFGLPFIWIMGTFLATL